jgi:hypothetical protein
MLQIKERKWVKTGSPTSRLQFEVELPTRYLLIDGRRAYMLGMCCQTCSFLFERLSGANQAVEIEKTAEVLRQGVKSLEEIVVDVIGQGIPQGEYLAVLAESRVTNVRPGEANDYFVSEAIALWGEDTFWCLPHDPRVPYYRAGEMDLGSGRKLFNFIVPMFPAKWLSMTTAAEYREALRTKASGTAVSIAVLDVRSPAILGSPKPDASEHWCLTHYLLDGHHKLNAASESGKPLNLLSFVAPSFGVSTREQIEEAICALSIPTALS